MTNAMNPPRIILNAFINIFGITKPDPAAEAKASRSVALMLLGVLVCVGTAIVILRQAFAF
jgi:hypothetical protein